MIGTEAVVDGAGIVIGTGAAAAGTGRIAGIGATVARAGVADDVTGAIEVTVATAESLGNPVGIAEIVATGVIAGIERVAEPPGKESRASRSRRSRTRRVPRRGTSAPLASFCSAPSSE